MRIEPDTEKVLLQIRQDLVDFEKAHDVYEDLSIDDMGFVWKRRVRTFTTIDDDTRNLIRKLHDRIDTLGINYHKKL